MESNPLFLFVLSVGSYLVGSFPTAYVVVRKFAHKNVMEYGSGNVGTMNTLRATGSLSLTLLVLIGDMGKGAVAVVAAYFLAGAFDYDKEMAVAVAGIVAVLGHNYPLFLKFKGGKGIATAGAVLIMVEPLLTLLWLGVFFITILFTRLFVLGQILATIAIPIGAVFLFPDSYITLSILAAIVFIKHAPRIKNIVEGTEPKMYYKIRPPQ